MKWKFFLITAATYLLSTTGFAQTKNAPKLDKKIVVVYGDSITMGTQLQNQGQRWASLVESQSKRHAANHQ